ncbi:unnamed protein product [Acanthoscelides obtectus]|uniref:Uncharacterized protein n=1 Tax=Acanthoscelides obtectus TaxID=200917 RepID=A0A9P0L0V3_ACAOB|nr:unnamed protein product [Acanthoscelides obtectus]CAK1651698.1 hypothetical protein AOBTE_LOCUS17397 [Acanthoscelides obtectus]
MIYHFMPLFAQSFSQKRFNRRQKNSTKAFSSSISRAFEANRENEINLAKEIALSHSNSEQLESRDLPRTNKVTRSKNRNGM